MADLRENSNSKIKPDSMFEENPKMKSHIKLVESNFLQKRKTQEICSPKKFSQKSLKINDENFLKALRTMRDSLGLIHKKSTGKLIFCYILDY